MIRKIKNKFYTDRYYIYSVLIAVVVLIVGVLIATVNNENPTTPLFPIRVIIGLCGIWVFYLWAFFKIIKNNKDKFLLKEPWGRNFFRKFCYWFCVFFFTCMYIIIIISFLVSHEISFLITGLLSTTIFLLMILGLGGLYYSRSK